MASSMAAIVRPQRCFEVEARARIDAGSSFRPVVNSSKWSRKKKSPRFFSSSMLGMWRDSRDSSRVLWRMVKFRTQVRKCHCMPVVVDEIAGQYEDSYEDVDKHLMDYFTYKAVRTVLAQLYEMNPQQYMFFYNFVSKNKPQDGKAFIRLLVKERQELAERVMVTRLHLFGKWVKKYSHETMYNAISDQNLELLRERLIQTVKLPSDGEDFQKFPPSSTP